MTEGDEKLGGLVELIIRGECPGMAEALAASPGLARSAFQFGATRREPEAYFLDAIGRYIYAGDTALHFAAAAYRAEIVHLLLENGADIQARNRHGATALHDASSGSPGSAMWDPDGQVATIACLIAAGADPNAPDKRGVTPLHKAVRTRCAAAVRALLERGADPWLTNSSGSTPQLLARVNSGRGGTGSPEAKLQLREIVTVFEEYSRPVPDAGRGL